MDDLREPTDIGPVRITQTHHTSTYGIRVQPLPTDTLLRIARALAAAGLLEEFAILGRNPGWRGRLALSVITDSSRHIDWSAVLGIDLTPEHALTLAAQLERHAEEPPECDLRTECGGDFATVQVNPTRFACDACAARIPETQVA